MAQLIGLGIENFRIFKDATEFDFAPLTLLTGANNSGKSSLIKALLLLAVNANKKLERFTLDFEAETGITKLGDFASVANNKDNYIKFSLNLKNLYKELDRPVHHEKLADEIFEKLAIKPFIVEMKFNAQKENNMTNFSLYCVDKEEKIKLLSFNFIEKAQKVDKQEINYVWLEKFIYDIQGKTFKDKDELLQNFNHPIERFKDLFSVIDLAFNTNGNKELKKYHFSILDDILKKLVEIAFETIEFGDKIEYLPAFRGNQERFYRSDSDLPLNQLLKQFTDSSFDEESKEKTYITKWLNELGIGDKIDFIPRIGGTEVNITKNGKKLQMADIGYGMTQYLPLLLKIVLSEANYLLIEEAENSLHPDFQSKLADILVDAYKNFGTKFIIETHSEYLIRKLQYLTVKKTVSVNDIAIYYFGLDGQVRKIDIQEDGELKQEFGKGFFDESARWIGNIWKATNLN